jgi:hypothetical protein
MPLCRRSGRANVPLLRQKKVSQEKATLVTAVQVKNTPQRFKDGSFQAF